VETLFCTLSFKMHGLKNNDCNSLPELNHN
jgi:hypothetical protein